MFRDWLSGSCEEGGGISLMGNEHERMSQHFEGKFFNISLIFLLSFTSYFSQDKLIGLGMPLFHWPCLGSVRQEIIVMTILKTSHVHTLHIQAI